MSGGSLNYLFSKEPGDLFEGYLLESMETAETVLIQKGYTDIARDVRRLIEYIRTAENRIGVLHEQLADVFHAIEWYISADYGERSLIEHLDQYRAGGKNNAKNT